VDPYRSRWQKTDRSTMHIAYQSPAELPALSCVAVFLELPGCPPGNWGTRLESCRWITSEEPGVRKLL
jgi:hypothetical protein